jgi:arylsulfatase A-like enzyme
MKKFTIIILFLSICIYFSGYKKTIIIPKTEIDRVVVIHLDTTRQDDIGSYSGLVETPNIDNLANIGMRYTNSITTVPKTSPSIANFFTGSYARNNGVYKVGHALNKRQRTIAEEFQSNGYKTVGYTANMSISDIGYVKSISTESQKHKKIRKLNYDQGFDEFHSFPPYTDTSKGTIEDIIKSSMGYVDQNKESKFFMWMLVVEPHGPYTPPKPFDTMYTQGQELLVDSQDIYINGPNDSLDPTDGDDGHIKSVTGISYVEGENNSDYYVARHMSEVSYTDHWIGKLIDQIKELPGKTLFVVTADHGESFGDVDFWFDHGNNVRYPGVNVPLIISCDGLIPVGVNDALVANIDLAPTILDLLNIDDKKFSTDGRSLVPTFTEESPWPNRVIPIRSTMNWRGVRSMNYSFQCIYDPKNTKKTFVSLFNRTLDPKEQHNLAKSDLDILQLHETFFDQWFSDPNNVPVEEIDLTNDEEMQERLRSLGYLE